MTRPRLDAAHAHPLVREFFRLVDLRGIRYMEIEARAGLAHSCLPYWKSRSTPRLETFVAALNAIGYELVIQERK